MPDTTIDELAAKIDALTTHLAVLQAATDAITGKMRIINKVGTGPIYLTADDYAAFVIVTRGSAGSVTVVLPATAPEGATLVLCGWDCQIIMDVAPGGGRTNWQDQITSAAPRAPLTCTCFVNSDGGSAGWFVNGATA